MNNVCTKNMNDTVLLEQFNELVNEIRQIEDVVNHQSAARTMCNIGGGGCN